MRVSESLRWLGAALFPEQCASCAQSALRGLCDVCIGALPRVANPCPRCGLASPVASCPRRANAWTVDRVVTPFAYAAPLEDYVQALKYRRVRVFGRALGALLAAEAAAEAARSTGATPRAVQALVPVPLAPRRLRERGYNQAFEIARAAGRVLGVPVLGRGIARRDAGRTQIGRGAAERHASVRGAFVVTRDLAGVHLAIVDDVITTGATVNALAQALAAAGAARVDAWAVARTAAPSNP